MVDPNAMNWFLIFSSFTGNSEWQSIWWITDPSCLSYIHLLHPLGSSLGKLLKLLLKIITPHFQPFLDQDHFLHNFFLPQVYAITLPLGGIAALLVLVGKGRATKKLLL